MSISDFYIQNNIHRFHYNMDDFRRMMKKRHRGSRFKNRTLQKRLLALEEEHDELELMVTTLFRLLLKKGVIEEEEFFELMFDVDGEDGELDGKVTKKRKEIKKEEMTFKPATKKKKSLNKNFLSK